MGLSADLAIACTARWQSQPSKLVLQSSLPSTGRPAPVEGEQYSWSPDSGEVTRR
jgi:hypothetical protein